MAGDWIKMRDNLWDDPRVSRLCDLVGQSEAPVIGGLYWLWANADQHSVDGILPGLTLLAIDRKTRIKGFGKALVDVGWASETEAGVSIPRFTEHNGESAKQRAAGQKRKANWRAKTAEKLPTEGDKGGTTVPQDAGQGGDKSGTSPRPEKRREENLLTTAVDDSSIPACARPAAGGEITPPDPSILARIAVECARVKIQGLTPSIIERWASQGATPSLAARAIAEAAISWTKTGGKGEIPSGYVSTTLERILTHEAEARAIVANREAKTRETIAEIKAASATAAPPPPDLLEAARKAARQ